MTGCLDTPCSAKTAHAQAANERANDVKVRVGTRQGYALAARDVEQCVTMMTNMVTQGLSQFLSFFNNP